MRRVMHYSLESHMRAESVNLPCGCRITETSVLAMCLEHVDQIARQRAKRDKWYAEFRDLLNKAAAP